MLDTVFGLPMHPLIVHATVVIVPTAALLVALAAIYPRFRGWAGPVPALAALLSCVLVPLSTGRARSCSTGSATPRWWRSTPILPSR